MTELTPEARARLRTYYQAKADACRSVLAETPTGRLGATQASRIARSRSRLAVLEAKLAALDAEQVAAPDELPRAPQSG